MIDRLHLDPNKFAQIFYPSLFLEVMLKLERRSIIIMGIISNANTKIGSHIIINTYA